MPESPGNLNATGRREFLRLASASPLLAQQAGTPRANTTKPNIVIIMADQMHDGMTRASGFPLDTMPTLDSLGAAGASFARAYACAPLCVPSRVSLLTGRWPHAHRVRQNSAPRAAVFEKDLFGVAKDLGYRTGLAGKNHSYLKAADLDFWREYSHLKGWQSPDEPKETVEFDAWLVRENFSNEYAAAPFPVEAQHPYRIASDAIEFIESNGSQPFALWVSFPEPHNPYQVSEPYFSMFPPDQVPARAVGPEALDVKGFKWHWLRGLEETTYPGYDANWRKIRSIYLGMLRLIDDQIKRLVDCLSRKGIRDNTIIVYLTDHGDYFMDYGLMRKGVGMPEELVNIPFIWSGSGIAQQGRVEDAMVSTADVMPTLCEAIGAEIPHGAQGRSLWPLLQKQPYPKEEFRSIYSEVGYGGMYYTEADHVPYSIAKMQSPAAAKAGFDELNPVTQCGNLKMVRMGEWKLLYDMMGNGQLYNLAEDPHELTNRFQDESAARDRDRMLQELLTWTIRTQDDLPVAAYKVKWPSRNWYATYRKDSQVY